jgi:predicted Zn-dependent protease
MTEILARWLRFASPGVLAGALALVAACSVSERDEQELGAYEAAEMDSTLPVIRDSVLTAYIGTVGRSMTSRTSRAGLDWRFTLVNSLEMNAFALPGGYVYVTRGLIENAERLDELAGVMGHEIAHVVQRHSVKQLEQAGKRDAALVLLCTLTRACSSVDGAIAVQVGADAVAAQYSQADEAEADSAGVLITLGAGVDPRGLPTFLQHMLEQRTDQPTPIDAFFATHPTDEARIAALNRQITALGPAGRQELVRDTPEFHEIQDRLRALPPPPDPQETASSAR